MDRKLDFILKGLRFVHSFSLISVFKKVQMVLLRRFIR
jgi:hypothetical protein